MGAGECFQLGPVLIRQGDGGAYGTGIGAILVSCQVKQRCVLFENDRNPQSCPDKSGGIYEMDIWVCLRQTR